ncbi:MAG: sugar isomerase [Bacteroidia bacterium]|nr:sugar isomerase [Bacteroidia bacterium]
MTVLKLKSLRLSQEKLFMGSALLVNGGNYLYNVLVGRILGPEAFAEAALLVTLLLVISFLGMTFQLATTKFAVLLNGQQWQALRSKISMYALWIGIGLGCVVALFARNLQAWFSTASPWMFVLFGLGIPLYFLMSIKRGEYQGNNALDKLSISYQAEMWSRLIITILLLMLIPYSPGLLVSAGILISFAFGFLPYENGNRIRSVKITLSSENKRNLNHFLLLTAGYELTQILINNFDVILVKHYFDAYQAGLYASMALIGRVVYFVAWMFAMLLLPKVIRQQKKGEPTAPVLFRYVILIALLAVTIVGLCLFFPEQIVTVMFGPAYMPIAGMLWQYALATALFAISNIFAYYYLSLDQYLPVIVSALVGLLQLVLIVFFHDTLEGVVQIQIGSMFCLLLLQVAYYYLNRDRKILKA